MMCVLFLSRILNKTCRQDWPITARRAEIRHVGTRVNWRQFFTDRSGKYFITVAVSSPKTTCVTADHVRPNKIPMNRPIIYHLSHDNSHLLRDIFILSHDQWDFHFEITGDPCYLILTGSNWCDLFTNRTNFCFKLHLFLSQWGGYTKNKTTNQIPRRV